MNSNEGPDPRGLGELDEAALWADLLSLPRRGREEQLSVERMLELWARANGASAVALYMPAGTGHRLVARHGEADLPERLDESADSGGGLSRLPLPRGHLLLYDSAAAANEVSSPEGLLLACVASIIQLKDELEERKLFAMTQGIELVALYEVGLAIASILDLDQLVEELLSRALMLLDVHRGALYQLEEGKYVLTRASGAAANELDPESVTFGALSIGDSSASTLLPGARNVLVVPVGGEESRTGLLVVGSEEENAPFQAKDRRVLTLFANQAAIALEKARLHRLSIEKERQDRELELAAEIQQGLLPEAMPRIPGFDVLGWNRPVRVVGGDYFAFRDLGEGLWALVIGDVSGKGSPAALLVSTVDSALRVLFDRDRLDQELVRRLNQYVFEASTGNKYVTMVLAGLDTATGRLDFVNAGHNAGLLIREDGRVEQLESSGSPVGLLPRMEYVQMQVEVGPGDLVCLYSDGITEAENPAEEEFGLARLIDVLSEHRARPLAEIEQVLNETLTRFSDGEPQGDDQTVILLRRKHGSEIR